MWSAASAMSVRGPTVSRSRVIRSPIFVALGSPPPGTTGNQGGPGGVSGGGAPGPPPPGWARTRGELEALGGALGEHPADRQARRGGGGGRVADVEDAVAVREVEVIG